MRRRRMDASNFTLLLALASSNNNTELLSQLLKPSDLC